MDYVRRILGMVTSASWAAGLPVVFGCLEPIEAKVQRAGLTAQDSAQLRLLTLQVARDTFGLPTSDTVRIWLRLLSGRDTSVAHVPSLPEASNEWVQIRRLLPGARALPDTIASIFICPAGVSVMMPGCGCPIYESGVVVDVGRFVQRGDTVHTTIHVTRSGAGRNRTVTWMEGMEMVVFTRTASGWQFRGARGRFIT